MPISIRVPLPERACVVKGRLQGFCRLGVPVFTIDAQTVYAFHLRGRLLNWVVLGCSVRSCLVRVSSTVSRVTASFARSVRSFFSICDRASTRPFVDARGPSGVSALGRCAPDTDEICSTVPRDSSPLYNQEHAWPSRPGPGDTSSWRGAAGIHTPKRRINTVTRVDLFPPIVRSCMLQLSNLGGGQGNGGNRPERRARARRGMRVGRAVHPCSFGAHRIPL